MVLDIDGSNTDTFVDADSPSQDADQYAQGSRPGNMIQVQGPPNQLFVPFDQLQKPFMSARRAWEGNKGYVEHMISTRCSAVSNVVKRPLRQEEANALAYNLSHGIYLASLYKPVSLIAAGFGWYRFPDRMTFPGGWRPGKEGSRFTPEAFGPIRGRTARALWKLSAFGAHGTVWTISMGMLFVVYGQITAQVYDGRDPRLHDYNEALKQRAAERSSRAVQTAQAQGTTTQQETFEQRRQRMAVQKVPRQTSYDDASPTGGMFMSDYGSSDIESEFMTDAQASEKRDSSRDAAPPQQAPRSSQASQPPQQQPSRSSFDDMTDEPKAAPASGNAWDRLRQQAMNKGGSNDRSS